MLCDPSLIAQPWSLKWAVSIAADARCYLKNLEYDNSRGCNLAIQNPGYDLQIKPIETLLDITLSTHNVSDLKYNYFIHIDGFADFRMADTDKPSFSTLLMACMIDNTSIASGLHALLYWGTWNNQDSIKNPYGLRLTRFFTPNQILQGRLGISSSNPHYWVNMVLDSMWLQESTWPGAIAYACKTSARLNIAMFHCNFMSSVR